MKTRAEARVLIVGVGGIGCPLALVLARAGVGTLGLVDDDRVDGTNLHRQILFADADVGAHKLDAAARGLARLLDGAGGHDVRLELHRTRYVPASALALARDYDVVVEGADNFPTKFLVADAARLARRPVVHAAAVETRGTVFAVGPEGRPCYRCVYEDLPREEAPNCADAGVLGPLVGLVGSVAADLTLAVLDGTKGGAAPFGRFVHVDASGAVPTLRDRVFGARGGCALCGASPTVGAIDEARYAPHACERGPS